MNFSKNSSEGYSRSPKSVFLIYISEKSSNFLQTAIWNIIKNIWIFLSFYGFLTAGIFSSFSENTRDFFEARDVNDPGNRDFLKFWNFSPRNSGFFIMSRFLIPGIFANSVWLMQNPRVSGFLTFGIYRRFLYLWDRDIYPRDFRKLRGINAKSPGFGIFSFVISRGFFYSWDQDFFREFNVKISEFLPKLKFLKLI